MQAEGLRKGDRLDTYDDMGQVNGGWTVTARGTLDGPLVKVPVKYHDGRTGVLVWGYGEDVPITWGAGS